MSAHRKFDFKKQHFAGEEGRLIPLLQKAQESDGYITLDRMREIEAESGVPLAQIYGVATFYAQFRMTPVGKKLVKVCHGTACHVSGAERIDQAIEESLGIRSGETTADRQFSVETVSCLGCCSLAPVIMIADETFGNLTPKEVKKVLEGQGAKVPVEVKG